MSVSYKVGVFLFVSCKLLHSTVFPLAAFHHDVTHSKQGVEVRVCEGGSGGGWGVLGVINFLSLVGSHLMPGAHLAERTLGSHFVYGSK